ncbi:MAG: hypothetical protein ACD_2C00271G0001, partial [uncultured bacterium (gcode 4)]
YVPTPTLFWINTSNSPSLIYDSSFSSWTIILPWDNTFANFNSAMVYSTWWSNLSSDDILDLMQTMQTAYSGSNVNTLMVLQLESADDTALANLWVWLVANVLWWTVPSWGGGWSQNPPAPTTFTLWQASLQVWATGSITNNCTSAPTGYTSSNTSVATVAWTTITAVSAWTTNITPVWGDCEDSNPVIFSVLSPAWSVSWWWDCTWVDNSIWANWTTSVCDDLRTYEMQWTWAVSDRKYNLLKIEWKWWFNENLAYPLATWYKWSNSWSINDMWYYACPWVNSSNNSNCSLVSSGWYLYQWSAATWMTWSLDSNLTVRWICPSGWHIPKSSEITSASNSYWPTSIDVWAWNIAWWHSSYMGCRVADSGGYYVNNGIYEYVITSLDYSIIDRSQIWLAYFDKWNSTKSYRSHNNKATGWSVRCIKD